MARSWLFAEQEQLAHLAALVRRGEVTLPVLPDEPEQAACPMPLRQAPKQPRWQEAADLRDAGLNTAQIAAAMGIGEGTARFYVWQATSREQPDRYRPIGSEAQAEAMAAGYPDIERQEWVRREMRKRDELIEHKRRRGR